MEFTTFHRVLCRTFLPGLRQVLSGVVIDFLSDCRVSTGMLAVACELKALQHIPEV